MNCDKIQEIILTDYLDGRLDEKGLRDIQRHAALCPKCAEFLAITEKTMDIFHKASRADFPQDVIWQRLKVQIQNESLEHRKTFKDLLAEWKNQWIFQPIPLTTIASLVIVFVTVGLVQWREFQLSQAKSVETSIQLLSYVNDELAPSSSDDGDYGTDIEAYFL